MNIGKHYSHLLNTIDFFLGQNNANNGTKIRVYFRDTTILYNFLVTYLNIKIKNIKKDKLLC
jgi:hypothetical protein